MTLSRRYGTTWLFLGLALLGSRLTATRGSAGPAMPLSSIDTEIAGWNGSEDPPLADRIASSLAATSYLSRTYRRDGRSLGLFIAYYANQRAGETMHSPKYCLPGGGWEMLASDEVRLNTGAAPVKVNNYLLVKPGERVRMLYWYQTRDRVIASEYSGKLFLVWDTMRHGGTAGAIVRVLVNDQPDALSDASAFAAQAIPRLARCFPE